MQVTKILFHKSRWNVGRTLVLHKVLTTLCEQMMPVEACLLKITWKSCYHDSPQTCQRFHFVIDVANQRFKNSTLSQIHLERFLQLLCELPVVIKELPGSYDSHNIQPTPEISDSVKKIDQLRKIYIGKESVQSLSLVCSQIIRKAIYPITSNKTNQLKLPYCLNQFVLQNYLGDRMYSIL